MTLEDFIEQTKHLPRNTLLQAFDPNDEAAMDITGFLFSPGEIPILEFCTDDMQV